MVLRQVLEGERHLANQRILIERLFEKGLPTEDAQVLLESFYRSQAQHEEHLQRLLHDQKLGLRDEDGNLLLGEFSSFRAVRV